MASLNTTIGALQIGFAPSTFLLGTVTVQLHFYLRHFPDDSKFLKALVCIVWLIELAHQLCLCTIDYGLLVTNPATTGPLQGPLPLSAAFLILFETFIAAAVQGFFASRLWRLSKGTKVFCVLIGLIVTRFSLNLAVAVLYFRSPTMANFSNANYKALMTSTWAISVATNLSVTILLSYDLYTRRSGDHRTSQLIDCLIIKIIATGTLTSISTILMLIFFLTMNGNFIWMAVFMVHPHFFSNAMLASLNSRRVRYRPTDAKDIYNTRPHFRLTSVHIDNEMELLTEAVSGTKNRQTV